MTRDELQQQVAEWSVEVDRIMLAWPTSVGKSRGFIAIQEKLQPKSTYIVVSELAHIENWEEEYRKHGKEDLLAKTTIFCYASLKKYVDTKVDLIGLDEVHHSSQLRLEYLKRIKTSKIVAMSATTNFDVSYALKHAFGTFRESVIPLSFAIEQGWIRKPQIVLIPLTLQSDERTEVYTIERKPVKRTVNCTFPERFKYLKIPNAKINIACTEYEKYVMYDELVQYYSRKYKESDYSDEKLGFMLKRAGLNRKKYLSTLKTSYIQNFLKSEELNGRRFICFCGSIEQAETLSDNVIHSKISHPERVLAKFKEGEINELFAVNMLKEGVNIPNIHACIITQLDSEERDFVQKAGRALRNPDDPTVYVFFFRDTRDEEYLRVAVKTLDSKYIQWI